MRPIDCAPTDWPLYYQRTFMIHEDLGLVSVTVDDDYQLHAVSGSADRIVPPETLTPCWPEAAAINTASYGGMYVGRGARREARRSATLGHYTVMYPERGLMMDHRIMHELVNPKPYPTLGRAIEMLADTTRVAFTRDLLLTAGNRLVCRGVEVGVIEGSEDRYTFEPDVLDSPLARRVQFKLDKEGVLCH